MERKLPVYFCDIRVWAPPKRRQDGWLRGMEMFLNNQYNMVTHISSPLNFSRSMNRDVLRLYGVVKSLLVCWVPWCGHYTKQRCELVIRTCELRYRHFVATKKLKRNMEGDGTIRPYKTSLVSVESGPYNSLCLYALVDFLTNTVLFLLSRHCCKCES